jgi:hypothetical protein
MSKLGMYLLQIIGEQIRHIVDEPFRNEKGFKASLFCNTSYQHIR